jgi:hypothetical protein
MWGTAAPRRRGTTSVPRTTAEGQIARMLRRRWAAADPRSGRVVFISHCLLDENAARGVSIAQTEHDMVAEITRAGAVAP